MFALLVLLATGVYLVLFVFAMRREMRAFYERERIAQRTSRRHPLVASCAQQL